MKREAYFGAVFNPEAPVSGAQVLVTEGAGAGQSATTAAGGAYRLELPPGPFRLRWSAQGLDPRESDPGTVIAGSTTTVDTVILRVMSVPDWSITGIVRDGVGNPVADTERPLEVLRTVHSFDPCIACAIHTLDVDGTELSRVKAL